MHDSSSNPLFKTAQSSLVTSTQYKITSNLIDLCPTNHVQSNYGHCVAKHENKSSVNDDTLTSSPLSFV